MYIKAVVFGILLIITLAGETFSQVENKRKPPSAEDLFDLASANHKSELNGLLNYRGGPIIRMESATSKAVARALGTRGLGGQAGYAKHTSVLFYSYVRDQLSIWLVDERGIAASSKDEVREVEINRVITDLRYSLGVNTLQLSRSGHKRGAEIVSTPDHPKSLDLSIKKITSLLIPATIADRLDCTQHLIVVPVLGIGTVPFALLRPFGDDSFLIDKMSVTIAPSLFDLEQDIESWRSESRSPLVVGNPYLPPDPKWVLPPLPGAETEATEVAKILRTKALTGKDATKQTIVTEAPRADFLYFATHGISDSNDPLKKGFLMFSGPDFESGWWTVKEIQNSHFGAHAVVMSACQTGLGKVHDAGMIGLARAFQIAGVPRVVMSLWNVDDAATSELMQAFVKNLNEPPSEALRQAMLETKKKRPNPSEWASFVVFGTPR